jgi:hypothetical protein
MSDLRTPSSPDRRISRAAREPLRAPIATSSLYLVEQVDAITVE